jgi:hypothetical protein
VPDASALFLVGAVAAGAVAQSVSGIGFILVCGPALVAALGPHQGVGVAIVISAVLNAVVLAREWRSVRAADALLLFVPAALTTPLWARALRGLDPVVEARVAGAAVVVGVLMLAAGLRWHRAAGRAGALVAGTVSSAMNVAAATGGPAVALYATNAGWGQRDLRATLQAYFLALNVVALATLGVPPWTASTDVPVAVGLVAGLGLGALVAPRVGHKLARTVTLVLAGIGGALLLVTG